MLLSTPNDFLVKSALGCMSRWLSCCAFELNDGIVQLGVFVMFAITRNLDMAICNGYCA